MGLFLSGVARNKGRFAVLAAALATPTWFTPAVAGPCDCPGGCDARCDGAAPFIDGIPYYEYGGAVAPYAESSELGAAPRAADSFDGGTGLSAAPSQPFDGMSGQSANNGGSPVSSGLAMTGGAEPGSTFAAADAGYIDSAVVRNQFRFRYDFAYGSTTPDRAEFFYPQCGCFGPGAPGPGLPGVPETNIDFQEISAYVELARTNQFSVFIDSPVRFVNFQTVQDTSGFGDLQVGVKYALIATEDEAFTFQFRVYTPTGDGSKGLGTEHVSLEPGLLYYNEYEDWRLWGEFRTWIPIDGSRSTVNGERFAGEVLRYGVGLGYDVLKWDTRCSRERVTPIAEVVGWSILDGQVLDGALRSAETTIVNLKLGVRYSLNAHSLYMGYGNAVTGDQWYENLGRVEYRYNF